MHLLYYKHFLIVITLVYVVQLLLATFLFLLVIPFFHYHSYFEALLFLFQIFLPIQLFQFHILSEVLFFYLYYFFELIFLHFYSYLINSLDKFFFEFPNFLSFEFF